jgi:hypothetical protein
MLTYACMLTAGARARSMYNDLPERAASRNTDAMLTYADGC